MDSQSDPNGHLETAQDPPASQTTRASGGVASRLSVRTGSQGGLCVELPSPSLRQAPPTITDNKRDFELDEVDAEVSKKTRAMCIDSTELSKLG